MAWTVGRGRPRSAAHPPARRPGPPPIARPGPPPIARPGPPLQAGGAAYGWCLAGGAVVAVSFLGLAGYVALGYLVNVAMVALVVGLCAAGGWVAVEVRYRCEEHLAARRSRARARAAARAPRLVPLAPSVPARPER